MKEVRIPKKYNRTYVSSLLKRKKLYPTEVYMLVSVESLKETVEPFLSWDNEEGRKALKRFLKPEETELLYEKNHNLIDRCSGEEELAFIKADLKKASSFLEVHREILHLLETELNTVNSLSCIIIDKAYYCQRFIKDAERGKPVNPEVYAEDFKEDYADALYQYTCLVLYRSLYKTLEEKMPVPQLSEIMEVLHTYCGSMLTRNYQKLCNEYTIEEIQIIDPEAYKQLFEMFNEGYMEESAEKIAGFFEPEIEDKLKKHYLDPEQKGKVPLRNILQDVHIDIKSFICDSLDIKED